MSGPDVSQSGAPPRRAKAPWGGLRRIGDIWQGLGTSGAFFGTSGDGRRIFLYGLATSSSVVAVVNIENILTVLHERPQYSWVAPVIWEGSSWITFTLFMWIPWAALRIAPLTGRPRWRVPLVHAAAAVAFSFCHVAGFVLLRGAAYRLFNATYHFGAFGPHFLYEFGKDTFGYLLAITTFLLAGLFLARSAPAAGAAYSIRDGARILRVPIADILAIGSAGNYVEFVLRDGRKPLMRAALSSVEAEFAAHGFVRVHRSWLVNPARMTALKPEGSGDYTVELGDLSVPLSRRFPEALAKLRAA